jgi:hypothetical protein
MYNDMVIYRKSWVVALHILLKKERGQRILAVGIGIHTE